jgi:hypothetical protein
MCGELVHKALIISAMTYDCLAWEFVAATHFLQLQRMRNKFLRTTRNFPRYRSICDLHTAFNILYNNNVQETGNSDTKS